MDTLSDVHQSLSKADPPVKLWQKLLPLALIFFCASFNLTILANLKDAIVVTSAGAEALPFLASFCVLPASLASFFLYGEAAASLLRIMFKPVTVNRVQHPCLCFRSCLPCPC